MTMGSHQSATMVTDTWLTPPDIIQRLGLFDLDPCTPDQMPWLTAKKRYTKQDDGLEKDWNGRVWLNPPYSKEAVKWLRKMAAHQNGIALVFARTETSWFFETVWNAASGVLFLEGRIHFYNSDGVKAKANAGAPSVLVSYGAENAEILRCSGIKGKFIYINN